MKDTAAARRYSRALFQAASEQKGLALEEVEAQLRKISQLIRSDDRLHGALSHALLPAERKKVILQSALKSHGLSPAPVVLNFLSLLLNKKRLDLLNFILQDFDAAVDEKKGALKAYVRSAESLSESAKKEMEKRLSQLFNKKIVIENSVHPELLAGVVVKAGDVVIDNSLKTQLKNMKSRFEHGY